jgi:transposase-like protein
LIALGVRRDGQKVVLAIKNMGGESEAPWRAMLDDLASHGLGRPELVIVDGGKGLGAALASLWDDVPVQRCTVHKERNLLAHAPQHPTRSTSTSTTWCMPGAPRRSSPSASSF